MLTRRHFSAALGGATALNAAPPAQSAIPRWRGFNLLDLFQAMPARGGYPPPVSEDELRWIRDWGFNFIRIPMDYWFWIDGDWKTRKSMVLDDVFRIKEAAIEPVDRIVDLGRKFGLHVSLNLHRAPGYCINNADREPFVLWKDRLAEEAFVHHWGYFARRYKGVSELDLSFNLLNEAPKPREGYMSRDDYRRVMTLATEEIRAVTPRRIVIIDGLEVGNVVVDEMIPTKVAQSVHAYWPGQISHFRAGWVDRESKFPDPSWPVAENGSVKMGREQLEARFKPWGELAARGIGVHCGEAGCYNKTPHPVVLAWMRDVLETLAQYNIGWALWNFGGSFGIMDSGRTDIEYEDWRGRKLDRKLLSLLQEL